MIKRLFQFFRPQKTLPSVSIIPSRFRHAFNAHGIIDSDIPHFVPTLTFEDLASDNALLKKLTPHVINEVAHFFKIRTEWLKGVNAVIYEDSSYYKEPEAFFELINLTSSIHNVDSPLRILTTVKEFDYTSSIPQPFIPILIEKIGKLGEEDIYRYYIEPMWDWLHLPCRLQIKAHATFLYERWHQTIPIYQVSMKALEAIGGKKLIPTDYIHDYISTNPSLEDYVLPPKSSGMAKESEELSSVANYIEENKLTELLIPHQPYVKPATFTTPKDQSIKAKKAATSRHQDSNLLKDRFIHEYLLKVSQNELSQAQAARNFYDSLSEPEEKLLARSIADHESSSPDERREKACRTLTTHLRKHLKSSQT